MKTKFGKLAIFSALVSLLLLSLIILTSCDSRLGEPVNLRLDVPTQTLKWNRVAKARGYAVHISGDEREKTLRTNSISLENLAPGEYEIKVKTLGDGVESKDSNWVTFHYTREAESGLKYKLINNGTAYELVGAGTAVGDIIMEDYYRGNPVISISKKAFAGNTDITSITIGKNVQSIGESAFLRCTSLKSITFPEDGALTSIGEYAFQSCKAIESITLPNTLTEIAPYTFSWCQSLKSVKLGSATETVGGYSFSSCDKLASLSMPETVKIIGEYAFADCKLLADISLSPAIEVIGNAAFYNCELLPNADFGNNLKSIGEFAFGNCKKITKVDIPDSCSTIGTYAFISCESLADVSLGSGLRTVGGEAFVETKLYEADSDIICIDGWLVKVLNREIEELVLPDGIYGIASNSAAGCKLVQNLDLTGIKYVNDYAFAGCESLQTALFDDSLLALDNYSFYACPLLRKVYLGNNIESIGDYAFGQCARISDTRECISLPRTLKHIGSSAFYKTAAFNQTEAGFVYIDDWAVDCMDLGIAAYPQLIIKDGIRGISNYCADKIRVMDFVYIPSTVEYIGRGAFYSLSLVKAFYLPNNLKYIGDYAFYNCYSAQFGMYAQLDIPSKTEYIGRSAFYQCYSIAGVNIPSGVKSIGDFAFYGCINIGANIVDENGTQLMTGALTLNEGLESIGNRAFLGCEKLSSVTIPNSVKSIGEKVFYKCSALSEVTLGSGISNIGEYCFYNCTALKSISIPGNVTSIGKYAFRGCTALETVKIENGLEEIGDNTFYGCTSLKGITLPDSVKKIGNYAFRGCSAAESLIIPSSVTEIGKYALYGMNNVTIYCEAESILPLWHERWNVSYRPVYWGVTLSEDGYLVSFVKRTDNPSNFSEVDEMKPPVRDGYTFGGFSTEQGGTTASYTITNVTEATDGTVLYAIWIENSSTESDAE